jgi:hypothetical protein
MVTSVRPPMTFIKFTHLRGNNLTKSAQATLKKKNLCGIQDHVHLPWVINMIQICHTPYLSKYFQHLILSVT